MKKTKNAKHNFALYWPQLNSIKNGVRSIDIKDPELTHRIQRVLRLHEGDSCILFNKQHNISVVLEAVEKKRCILRIVKREKNKQLQPNITFFMPLLKKQALEEAIYSLVELGANTIQLIKTQKVQRAWGGKKERERLEKIMIAAAEQSKYFALPQLLEPQSLEDALVLLEKKTTLVFFDPTGEKIDTILPSLKKIEDFVLVIGPEGDLAPAEKKLLHDHQALFCSLTPTVLRARQAVVVSLGIFRSLLV